MAIEQHELAVSGMSCEHCRCRVQRALESMTGVRSAEVDLETGMVTVEAEAAEVSRERLAAAIEKTGYTVVDAPG